ncbi:WXG100 family type VII secretion target [Williamsia sp.]|jgi:WXG100 family type VII secretion target|uniref:WXG100 family type VII secretion target n=1 Tax=Williamsia sp. TaxID=1872085 RepID=UPI002F94A7C3
MVAEGGNSGLQLDVPDALVTTKSVGQLVEDMGVVLTRINKNAEDAQAMWQGTASKAFQDAAAAWQAEGAQLKTALDSLKASLESGFNGYENEDTDLAGTINSVTGGGSSLNL